MSEIRQCAEFKTEISKFDKPTSDKSLRGNWTHRVNPVLVFDPATFHKALVLEKTNCQTTKIVRIDVRYSVCEIHFNERRLKVHVVDYDVKQLVRSKADL